MRLHQVESWALRIIDQVEAGRPNEDSRVELKAEWPTDIPRVARQIAGHANAARGEPILWLIGVDQSNGVTGAEHTELASWYPRVQAQFDGLAPQLTDINIPVKGRIVVALLFVTDRVPFVVKNPVHGSRGGGSVEREVPWRESTSTRSATRDELLRLLSPLQLLPNIEPLKGHFELSSSADNNHSFHLDLELYVTPRSQSRIVIPFHRCEVSFEIPGCTIQVSFNEVRLVHPYSGGFGTEAKNLSLTVRSTTNEVLIDGPGLVNLQASVTTSPITAIYSCSSREVVIRATLLPVDVETAISINTSMRPLKSEEAESDDASGLRDIKYRWKFDAR